MHLLAGPRCVSTLEPPFETRMRRRIAAVPFIPLHACGRPVAQRPAVLDGVPCLCRADGLAKLCRFSRLRGLPQRVAPIKNSIDCWYRHGSLIPGQHQVPSVCARIGQARG